MVTDITCANYGIGSGGGSFCRALNVKACANDCWAWRDRETVDVKPCDTCKNISLHCNRNCFKFEEAEAELERRGNDL